jgi:hypothetical protein
VLWSVQRQTPTSARTPNSTLATHLVRDALQVTHQAGCRHREVRLQPTTHVLAATLLQAFAICPAFHPQSSSRPRPSLPPPSQMIASQPQQIQASIVPPQSAASPNPARSLPVLLQAGTSATRTCSKRFCVTAGACTAHWSEHLCSRPQRSTKAPAAHPVSHPRVSPMTHTHLRPDLSIARTPQRSTRHSRAAVQAFRSLTRT